MLTPIQFYIEMFYQLAYNCVFPKCKQTELALKITTCFYTTFHSTEYSQASSKSPCKFGEHLYCIYMKKLKAREIALENTSHPEAGAMVFSLQFPRL